MPPTPEQLEFIRLGLIRHLGIYRRRDPDPTGADPTDDYFARALESRPRETVDDDFTRTGNLHRVATGRGDLDGLPH